MGGKFSKTGLLFSLILNGCDHNKVLLDYDKSSHALQDIHYNSISELSMIEKNNLGSTACIISYFKNLNADGKSFINIKNQAHHF